MLHKKNFSKNRTSRLNTNCDNNINAPFKTSYNNSPNSQQCGCWTRLLPQRFRLCFGPCHKILKTEFYKIRPTQTFTGQVCHNNVEKKHNKTAQFGNKCADCCRRAAETGETCSRRCSLQLIKENAPNWDLCLPFSAGGRKSPIN